MRIELLGMVAPRRPVSNLQLLFLPLIRDRITALVRLNEARSRLFLSKCTP